MEVDEDRQEANGTLDAGVEVSKSPQQLAEIVEHSGIERRRIEAPLTSGIEGWCVGSCAVRETIGQHEPPHHADPEVVEMLQVSIDLNGPARSGQAAPPSGR